MTSAITLGRITMLESFGKHTRACHRIVNLRVWFLSLRMTCPLLPAFSSIGTSPGLSVVSFEKFDLSIRGIHLVGIFASIALTSSIQPPPVGFDTLADHAGRWLPCRAARSMLTWTG